MSPPPPPNLKLIGGRVAPPCPHPASYACDIVYTVHKVDLPMVILEHACPSGLS